MATTSERNGRVALALDPSHENVEALVFHLEKVDKESETAVLVALSILTGEHHAKSDEWLQWCSSNRETFSPEIPGDEAALAQRIQRAVALHNLQKIQTT